MFASVVTAAIRSIRTTVRAIGAVTHRKAASWLAAAAILALFIAW